MSQNHPFSREEVFPSWFANRIQDYLSASQMDIPLSLKTTTAVQVVPDANIGIAAVNIEGRWRFITTTIERAHPGGAAGTYVVWAVAEDNSVTNSPAVFTDHTNYAFELRITSGAAPTGSGIAVTTKIGEVDWSGTVITALRITRGAITGARIANGALSNSGSLEWTREAGGGLIPTIKPALIQELMPTATIAATARSTAPTGWKLCDGSAISRTTFAALFTAIGTTYGVGDGSTTFNLPDLRGRVPVGVDGTAARLSANDALGNSAGEEKHTLLLAEIPAHNHGVNDPTHAHGPGSFFVNGLWTPGQEFFNEFNTHSPQGGFNAVTTWGASGSKGVQGASAGAATGVSIQNNGGGGAHNVMQPYQVINWMIKT